MAEKIAGVTDDAVRDATGQGWRDWFAILDEQDGTTLDHKARVAALADAGVESSWWQQTLAVGYERERGLRDVGETADAGYQVGVQRTLPVEQDRLWSVLTSAEGRRVWLGDVEGFAAEPGRSYETIDGISGDIRTVSAGERLRLTWRSPEQDASTTLQVTLSCPRNDETKTTLRIHHERLADAAEREAMRDRWRAVLDDLETMVDSAADR